MALDLYFYWELLWYVCGTVTNFNKSIKSTDSQEPIHIHEYYTSKTQKKKEKDTSELFTGSEMIPVGPIVSKCWRR